MGTARRRAARAMCRDGAAKRRAPFAMPRLALRVTFELCPRATLSSTARSLTCMASVTVRRSSTRVRVPLAMLVRSPKPFCTVPTSSSCCEAIASCCAAIASCWAAMEDWLASNASVWRPTVACRRLSSDVTCLSSVFRPADSRRTLASSSWRSWLRDCASFRRSSRRSIAV